VSGAAIWNKSPRSFVLADWPTRQKIFKFSSVQFNAFASLQQHQLGHCLWADPDNGGLLVLSAHDLGGF
jgi:hypothetical protein